MFFLLLVSVHFLRPLTFIIAVGGEDCQLKHNQLISPQGPHFSPHSTAKTNDKSTNLRKNGIYLYKLCCDRFSILGENPSEEVYDDYNMIMNQSQETAVFHGRQKLTSV